MSGSWSEEWERQKSYLVRSLFEDVSKLSPIAETSETDILSTKTRAYSPLPDLIIEKEKNRHDESEEFYRELEVRMIKLYKKLFHGVKDDSSEETLKLIEFVDGYNPYTVWEQNMLDLDISQYNLDTDSSVDDSDTSDASGVNEALDTAHHTLTESRESNGTTISEESLSITHKIIVTQAIVHAEAADNDSEDFNNNRIVHQRISRSISTERSIIIDLNHKQVDYMLYNKDMRRKITDSDRLVATQAYTNEEINPVETALLDDYEDVYDVMRLTTRKAKSFGSILEESTASKQKESLTPIAMLEGRMSTIEDVEFSSESAIDSVPSEENILNQAFAARNSISSTGKRTRSSTSDDTPNKRKRSETISVQTDPTIETNWDRVRDNFFVGTPLIYNLCHCRNHTCN